MRSPALAITWEIGRQHRWGFIAIAGYLLVLAAIRWVMLASGQPADVKEGLGFAFTVMVPASSTILYLIAVFSFGYTGDLAARESMYPARMLALPVSTATLAGLPMLCGTTAVAILWAATRLIAVFPSAWNVPLVWPALFVAAFLAWTQVLTWMPYGWRGLRVVVAVSLLMSADTATILAIHFEASELLMSAVFAPLVPLAYLAARVAVARARRGEVPDWTLVRLRARAGIRSRARGHFVSPDRAQLWFEWRSSGRSLPTLVAVVLPFELGLVFVPGNDSTAMVFVTLVAVLLTPLVMARVAAATIRTANPHGRDAYGLTTFMATRPLTNATLIAAKLKMAMWSTMVTWVLVLVAIPLALVLSGTWALAIDEFDRAADAIGRPRVIVLSLLGFSALVVATWKQLVQSLCIGLTGRGWLVKSSVLATLTFVAWIPPLLEWIHENRELRIAVFNALPWISAVPVAVKMSAAAWIATRLYRTRVLSDRTLVTFAAGWMVTVLSLYGLLAWIDSSPQFPDYFLVLVAILFVPLPRLAAAPLALAWNRHR